ncbi:MAG TPA: glycosyltransferase, partial [Bryobacteraceae bacterium]|nr:glycosyltransferase [Bryobacteraceae bacterium]
MAAKFKQAVRLLLGRDAPAVVVSFCAGPAELALRMVQEMRELLPDHEHYAVARYEVPGVRTINPAELPGPLQGKRIGLAPTLMGGDGRIWRLALRYAPLKILAYNGGLERHHLRLTTPVASLLFLLGVPLDRIWLRPRWLVPWRRDRSVYPQTHAEFTGRAFRHGRRRIGVLSPYLPFPLSHGGAVRIFNLLREGSRDFDVVLFAFAEPGAAVEGTPLHEFCSRVFVFPNPRYREPRWSTIVPPEVNEFRSSYVRQTVSEARHRLRIDLLQVEYTWMATYSAEILVEHDVTFDLHAQVFENERTAASWMRWLRWRSYEQGAVRRYAAVVVMSARDAALLRSSNTHVIPNGVDLHRFTPEPESHGANLLFVGSFAHFPNVIAFRWFVEAVWPLLRTKVPEAHLTVIAGRNPELYLPSAPADPHIEIHGFISDVRPYYAASNVVVVPTRVSAGTNLKVLEAMSCERALVSTTSGCNGLDVTPGRDL